jgi:hypothetical protein
MRELADNRDDGQGGNRGLSFQYRLVAEYYKGDPVEVSAFDRRSRLAAATADVSEQQREFEQLERVVNKR